jgi:hypothetical protein
MVLVLFVPKKSLNIDFVWLNLLGRSVTFWPAKPETLIRVHKPAYIYPNPNKYCRIWYLLRRNAVDVSGMAKIPNGCNLFL